MERTVQGFKSSSWSIWKPLRVLQRVRSSSVGQVAWRAWSHCAPWFRFFPVSPVTSSLQKSNFVLSKTAQCDPGYCVRKDLEYPYRAHRRTKTSLSEPENVPLFFSLPCRSEATVVLRVTDPARAARDWESRVFTVPFVL